MNNVTVTVDLNQFDCYECGNGAEDFITTIFKQAAQEIVERQVESSLRDKINAFIGETFNNEFKNKIIESVTNNITTQLSDKMERTKQYKELKSGLEIESEQAIKTGLKDMVGNVVKSEMKNIFKNT